MAGRQGIAGAVGTEDGGILDRIEQLGFTGDSARVLDLLPLIHVAWADGRVQRAERAAVLAVLVERGIPKDSDAWVLIETLLEKRPSETFLAESLSLVRDLAERKGESGQEVVELCARVAEASGGLLGFGKSVSAVEQSLISKVAGALGEAAQAKFRALFEK